VYVKDNDLLTYIRLCFLEGEARQAGLPLKIRVPPAPGFTCLPQYMQHPGTGRETWLPVEEALQAGLPLYTNFPAAILTSRPQ
jgi:hypothetical protein